MWCPREPGARIRVGEVLLEVVRVAAPCKLLDDTIGRHAQEALRRRAGSVCRVLEGGIITVGDVVELLMPRLHALELVPNAAGDAVVRRDWQALHDAGLPSQLDHTSATNTPHVTILALPAIDADVETRATDLVGALLPVTVRVSGLAFLGGEKVTVARLLDVPPPVVRAVLDLRDEVGGERHRDGCPM